MIDSIDIERDKIEKTFADLETLYKVMEKDYSEGVNFIEPYVRELKRILGK